MACLLGEPEIVLEAPAPYPSRAAVDEVRLVKTAEYRRNSGTLDRLDKKRTR